MNVVLLDVKKILMKALMKDSRDSVVGKDFVE